MLIVNTYRTPVGGHPVVAYVDSEYHDNLTVGRSPHNSISCFLSI